VSRYQERVNLYVRSPHGLLHRVKPRSKKARTEFDDGYLRTLCGRLVETGWQRKPRALHNPADPHVCGVCRDLKGVMSKQTGT